jgi:hypothetical protein
MLNLVNKLSYIFIVLFLLFSCKNEKKEVTQEKMYYQHSVKFFGYKAYNRVYNAINDSMGNWINNKLGYYQYFSVSIRYQIDSLLCFNIDKNKFVTAILQQQLLSTGTQDNIWFFYGVKIKGKWYFFDGATIVLPRENYQKDASKPLSFSKLHEIAMQEVFSGYLVRKKKDAGFWKNLFAPEYEYEVNESWFDYHFKTSWGYYKNDKFIVPSTQKEWDSLYIEKALSVWKK